MNIFYALNLVDFASRVYIIVMFFLIFMKVRRTDMDIIKSMTFLKFNKIRYAFNYLVAISVSYLASSILEYPEFRLIYGGEYIHMVQDIFLIIFQTGVIYFLMIVHKAFNPEH